MQQIAATRVGVIRSPSGRSRGPCDRCGRTIQIGKNKGLHLCRSCRHDHIYIQLATRSA